MFRLGPIKFILVASILLIGQKTLAQAKLVQGDTEDKFFVDDPGQQSPPPPDKQPQLQAPTLQATPPVAPTQTDPGTGLKKPALNYTDSSTTESHPFFDWSQHQGETLVPHPLADQGLVEITKDRVYIYNVSKSEQHHAGTFHVGMFNPSNLSNPDGGQASTFADNYAPNNPMFMFDYEWQLWRIGIGKLGVTAGAGAYFAQGHGHFTHPNLNPNLVPEETFTLAVIPLNAGAIYRMQIWDNQLFVPFGSGGGTLIPFSEFRDDGYGPRFGGSVAAYVAAGFAFNLTYFDQLSALVLDREYGINRMYLMAEFREMINLDPHYDFSGSILNLGFTAEF